MPTSTLPTWQDSKSGYPNPLKLKREPIKANLDKREQLMTFKALRKVTPSYLSDLFTFRHNSSHELRNNDQVLHSNKPSINFLKRSYSYRGAVTWNSLPRDISKRYESVSIDSFKSFLNAYYANKTETLP